MSPKVIYGCTFVQVFFSTKIDTNVREFYNENLTDIKYFYWLEEPKKRNKTVNGN